MQTITRPDIVLIKEALNVYGDLEYLMYKICYHAAPTLFSSKPSSLICLNNNGKLKLKDIWDKYKETLKNLISLEFFEVKSNKDCVSILIYKREQLENILFINDVKSYLLSCGYDNYASVEEGLSLLRERNRNNCPDEIGIFLGYPLSDVIAFASRDTIKCCAVGYWRVYSNEKQALSLFEEYDNARKWVIETLVKGYMPTQLLLAS